MLISQEMIRFSFKHINNVQGKRENLREFQKAVRRILQGGNDDKD
jgi:hypothetical protein